MKKASVVVIAALVVLLAIPASTLYAQSEGTWFKVPFPFVVADKQMPAGYYHVESLYWNAVAIQRSGGNVGVITQCQPTTVPNGGEPTLIFRKYGHRYFLSEARLPRMDSGRKFYVTREELEIAGKLPRPENVEVAAK
jgi:hypothetical protein